MTTKERNKLLIEAHILLDDIEITISKMFASVNKQTYKELADKTIFANLQQIPYQTADSLLAA